MRKKILSAILSVCMVLTLMPTVAFAAAEPAAVIAAPLGTATDANDSGGNADSYSAALTADSKITVAATNLKRHNSSTSGQGWGYYVGVGIKHEEGNTYNVGWTKSKSPTIGDYKNDSTVIDGTTTVDSTQYDNFYFNIANAYKNSNQGICDNKPTGYISVKNNDRTTTYIVDFSGVTLAAPEIGEVKYFADGSTANEYAGNAKTDLGLAGGAPTDSDRDTLVIPINNLDPSKSYDTKLKVGDTVLTCNSDAQGTIDSERTSENGAEVLRITLNPTNPADNGSWLFTGERKPDVGNDWVNLYRIQVGTYTVEVCEHGDTSKAATPKEIGIGSVSFKNSADAEATTPVFYMQGEQVDLPNTPTAPEGKVFDGWKKDGSDEKVTDDQVTVGNTADVYTAQWKDPAQPSATTISGITVKTTDDTDTVSAVIGKVGTVTVNDGEVTAIKLTGAIKDPTAGGQEYAVTFTVDGADYTTTDAAITFIHTGDDLSVAPNPIEVKDVGTFKLDISGVSILKVEAPKAETKPAATIEKGDTNMTPEQVRIAQEAANEATDAISQGSTAVVTPNAETSTLPADKVEENKKAVEDAVLSAGKEAIGNTTNADAVTKLSEGGIADASEDNVKIITQPYFEIQVTGAVVQADETTGADVCVSLTYDLTYMVRAVATKSNVADNDIELKDNAQNPKNAVELGTKEVELPANTIVTIQLPLPNTFITALGGNTNPFVRHTDGKTLKGTYRGTVADKVLTFDNPHGFSKFTVLANFSPEAEINGNYFETLQEAVDAVTNGQTIVLQGNCEGSVTVGREVSFTVDPTANNYTYSITTATGFKNNATANNKFDIVKDNGGSGGDGGGGGSSATTYTVTVPSSIDHGKITVSPKNASKGNTVTITATPDEGYKLGTITVKGKDGKEIEVKEAGNGKYTFVMPASKVEISATFVEDDEKPTDPGQPTTPSAVTYSDVAETAWYYDAVKYVTEKGLMNGVGNGRFAPNSNLTRAMFAQILYNKAGKPAAGASAFTDVAAGQWYADAVSWAAAQGVVNGIGNGMFGPNNNITREQLAVMLYRYASSPAVTGSVTGFNDAGQISSYAKDAMAWATTNGVMNGKGDGRLDPKGLATRAEVAQMMQNYFK